MNIPDTSVMFDVFHLSRLVTILLLSPSNAPFKLVISDINSFGTSVVDGLNGLIWTVPSSRVFQPILTTLVGLSIA
ncbi:hypothetical protein [Mycoplasma capricolum]|uniref:hypothetical protein n=1 Tax=Mycoplasma TaxID=2093 RepID=UPI003DA1E394